MHLTLNGDAATLTSHSVKTGLFSIINDKARSNSAPGARSGLLASGGGQRAGFVAFESGCIPNLYVACGPAKSGYEQSSPDWRAEKAPRGSSSEWSKCEASLDDCSEKECDWNPIAFVVHGLFRARARACGPSVIGVMRRLREVIRQHEERTVYVDCES